MRVACDLVDQYSSHTKKNEGSGPCSNSSWELSLFSPSTAEKCWVVESRVFLFARVYACHIYKQSYSWCSLWERGGETLRSYVLVYGFGDCRVGIGGKPF